MADDQARIREAAIVAAYDAGQKVDRIEREFGVGRSTIYHYLRRSGRRPNRLEAGAKDAALAGLYELIQLQDERINEQDRELMALRTENRRLTRAANGSASKRKTAG